ncbi:MAG: 3-oxoacyl-[acyl-carrier-protein] reductase FabG [Candidatus Omnitrophica bacterium]|nr:3-oxoacyl-[acyl-carrier-protein] reductase FabG [Candidatus Omnitrophota bacterium]
MNPRSNRRIQDLKGRRALVTGASRGLGRHIALSLAGRGATVALSARDRSRLEGVRRTILRAGGKAIVCPADALSSAQVERAVETAVRRLGGLDILVNNAGGAERFAGLTELNESDWSAAYDLNVLSILRFTRAALPALRRSRSGRIINIASVSGLEPGRFNPHYSTAKAAAIHLSKVLANELAPMRITVNTVCPGPLRTDAWERNLADQAVRRRLPLSVCRKRVEQEEAAKVPLGRVGECSDVTGLVDWLAGDSAAWTTGSCLRIDGGKLRSIG